MLSALLLCCLLFINVQADTSTSELKIGAFNAQVFGKSKLGKAEVVETLTKIVSRYDVILIQEIRDSSMTVIFDFVESVNKMCSSTEPSLMFDIKISERLGRTSSKEQYAFLYRAEKVQVIDTHQYNDTLDLFEREPYSVLLAPAKGGTDFPPFFLVGIRTKPSDTVQELNALVDVYDELVDVFDTTNGVILGDMNADCRYLSQKNFEKLDLVTDPRFTWLIDSTVDTTISDTDCSYDRIIATGDILESIVDESANIFQFDKEYGLTEDEAKDVSDRYPVEFSIKGRTSTNEPLKICAFNIQVFGNSKFKKSTVVYTLSKIVRQCDVTLIQEIRDSSETVIHKFLDTVNRDCFAEGIKYSLSVSERLGRTNSKEQYAYIYRTDKVEVLAEYQYVDSADKFQREPFSVLLSSLQNDLPPFFLVGIHAQPSDVFEEMNALVNVYDEMVEVFKTSNGIILGDMNADCSYLSKTKYKQLDLVTDPRFSWLIDSTVDTTTSASDCCYDRVIVAGEIRCYVVGESAGVIKFDEAYGLSPKEAKIVSDHYPVMFHLQRDDTQHMGFQSDSSSYCNV